MSFDNNAPELEPTGRPPEFSREAAVIANFLAQFNGGKVTGWTLNWRPTWSRKLEFTYFFHDLKLAIDSFTDRPGLSQEIDEKKAKCEKHGVKYVFVLPDEEVDGEKLAIKCGLVRPPDNFYKRDSVPAGADS